MIPPQWFIELLVFLMGISLGSIIPCRLKCPWYDDYMKSIDSKEQRTNK